MLKSIFKDFQFFSLQNDPDNAKKHALNLAGLRGIAGTCETDYCSIKSFAVHIFYFIMLTKVYIATDQMFDKVNCDNRAIHLSQEAVRTYCYTHYD